MELTKMEKQIITNYMRWYSDIPTKYWNDEGWNYLRSIKKILNKLNQKINII